MKLLIALAVFVVVFSIALSSDVQALTSPVGLAHPVVVRKLLSITAFAIAGLAISPVLSKRSGILNATLAVTALSAAIEVAQRLGGSDESLRWNLIDLACGTIGGALGATVYVLFMKVRRVVTE